MGTLTNLIKQQVLTKGTEDHPYGIKNLDFNTTPGNIAARQSKVLSLKDPSKVTAKGAITVGCTAKILAAQDVIYAAYSKEQLNVGRNLGKILSTQNNFRVGMAQQNLQTTISNAQTAEQLSRTDFATNLVGKPMAAGVNWMVNATNRAEELVF
jgi:hypothetical protein